MRTRVNQDEHLAAMSPYVITVVARRRKPIEEAFGITSSFSIALVTV
jgi:hypothetical protein